MEGKGERETGRESMRPGWEDIRRKTTFLKEWISCGAKKNTTEVEAARESVKTMMSQNIRETYGLMGSRDAWWNVKELWMQKKKIHKRECCQNEDEKDI